MLQLSTERRSRRHLSASEAPPTSDPRLLLDCDSRTPHVIARLHRQFHLLPLLDPSVSLDRLFDLDAPEERLVGVPTLVQLSARAAQRVLSLEIEGAAKAKQTRRERRWKKRQAAAARKKSEPSLAEDRDVLVLNTAQHPLTSVPAAEALSDSALDLGSPPPQTAALQDDALRSLKEHMKLGCPAADQKGGAGGGEDGVAADSSSHNDTEGIIDVDEEEEEEEEEEGFRPEVSLR